MPRVAEICDSVLRRRFSGSYRCALMELDTERDPCKCERAGALHVQQAQADQRGSQNTAVPLKNPNGAYVGPVGPKTTHVYTCLRYLVWTTLISHSDYVSN